MEPTSESETMIRRYLLGDLRQEELETLECRLLSDADYLDCVSLLEEELVDEYVRGLLSPEEREKFETSFLCSPEGRREVRFAAGLRGRALEAKQTTVTEEASGRAKPRAQPFALGTYLSSKMHVARYLVAATAVTLLMLGAAAVFAVRYLQQEIKRLEAGQVAPGLREQELRDELSKERTQAEELSAKLRNEQEERSRLEQELVGLKTMKPAQLPSPLASIVLTSGRSRESRGGQKLTVDSATTRVSIQLVLRRADYGAYRVLLQNEENAELWSANSLKAQSYGRQKRILVSMPGNLMSDGDYSLKLYGVTDQGEYIEADNYYFRTVRK